MSWNNGDNRNFSLKLKSNLGLYRVLLSFPKTSPRKITQTVVEMQQSPDNRRSDSNEELPRLKRKIGKGRRKV